VAYTNCESSIEPGEKLCNQTHCNAYSETQTMKRVCKCLGPDGNRIPGCEPKNDSFPVPTNECFNTATKEIRNISWPACRALILEDPNWDWQKCFCCCSCFAYGTLIKTGAGAFQQVETFQVGDPVQAATVRLQNGRVELDWSVSNVAFSDGTSVAPDQIVVVIQYGESGEIVVTTDQPFLLPDGTLSRADFLVAGSVVVGDTGQPVTLTRVEIGKHTIGIHSIGTNAPFAHGIDKHLLSANGLVVGDQWLRGSQGSAEMKKFFPALASEQPRIGSDAYAQTKSARSAFSSVLPGNKREIRSEGFVPFEEVVGGEVPKYAVSFLTKDQADDIANNAPKADISGNRNRGNFQYLERLFSKLYPDIRLYLKWEDRSPNLFAFERYGCKVVYVSGALLRLESINYGGVAFLLAHGIARFIGAPPAQSDGLACRGQADYAGLGYVLLDAFYKNWSEVAIAAATEIEATFAYIDDKNRGGKNGCSDPSIDCRITVLEAVVSGFDLPACAGAPVAGGLKVDGAAFEMIEGIPVVNVTFNEAVDPRTVASLANYHIEPIAVVHVARVSPASDRIVQLGLELPPDAHGRHTVTVKDVLSVDGSTLDPELRSARFEVP
jgi:hypothetical protein